MLRSKNNITFLERYLLKNPAYLLMNIPERADCNSFGSKLSRKLDITPCSMIYCLKMLTKARLIEKKKDGRKNIIVLTNNGRKIQESLQAMREVATYEVSKLQSLHT